jgi:hypothetical protein
LRERSGNEPHESSAGDDRRRVRQPPGDQLTEEPVEGDDDGAHGHGEDDERGDVGGEFVAQPSFGLGARQVGNDDHAKGLRAEHEHEVDAVGRHEAVGLVVAAELVREVDAGEGAGAAQDEERQPGRQAAANGALAGQRARLGLFDGLHRCDEIRRL